MDGDDVRVVKPREHAGLAVEPLGERGGSGQRVWKQFEGDDSIQLGLARPLHNPHAAVADEFEYFQLRKGGGYQRDGRWRLPADRLAGFGWG